MKFLHVAYLNPQIATGEQAEKTPFTSLNFCDGIPTNGVHRIERERYFVNILTEQTHFVHV